MILRPGPVDFGGLRAGFGPGKLYQLWSKLLQGEFRLQVGLESGRPASNLVILVNLRI